MELRKLKSFLVVAKELHFGKAAEKLSITQPALTHQIQ
ncbi:MAG TPA: LysR family transcriptional regulator [Flavobacterium sp.]